MGRSPLLRRLRRESRLVRGVVTDILHRVLHGAVSAVTPDRFEAKYQHAAVIPPPQSFGQYLSSTAKSFDPRTPGGAFNLATFLIPGFKRGVPTPAQQDFLDMIYNSSRMGQQGRNAAGGYGIMKIGESLPESVSPLAEYVGAPSLGPARIGKNTTDYAAAYNPIFGLSRTAFHMREKGYPSAQAKQYAPINPAAQHIVGHTLQRDLNQILFGNRRN